SCHGSNSAVAPGLPRAGVFFPVAAPTSVRSILIIRSVHTAATLVLVFSLLRNVAESDRTASRLVLERSLSTSPPAAATAAYMSARAVALLNLTTDTPSVFCGAALTGLAALAFIAPLTET